MRTPLVIGNFKANTADPQAYAGLGRQGVEVAVCPPYLYIARAVEALAGTGVVVGGQDVFWQDSGAYTGRVSAPMLREAGATLCIVGHSETRGRFGKLEVPESTVGFFADTDETVNLKIQALLRHGLMPVLCVGETLQEREEGKTDEVIRAQLRGALKDVDFSGGVVAYEPVWAIGTGKTCDAPEAERVCALVRTTLGEVMGDGGNIRVLYGGSVKASNAVELFAQPNIDGGLVGGACLIPSEFAQIVQSAQKQTRLQ